MELICIPGPKKLSSVFDKVDLSFEDLEYLRNHNLQELAELKNHKISDQKKRNIFFKSIDSQLNKPPHKAIKASGQALADTLNCPNSRTGWYLCNIEEGKYIHLPCNLYSCPVCGRKKIQKLYKALVTYFGQWKYTRLWTFTLSSKMGTDIQSHYKLLAETWRRFTTEIRRNKCFTKSQNGVQYVKFIEAHKSGFIHFHVLVSAYLPWKNIQALWERCARDTCKVDGHIASANVRGVLSARPAAKYVTKYVTKAVFEIEIRIRRYTKSGRVSLFKKHQSGGGWFIYISHEDISYERSREFEANYLNLSQVVTTSQTHGPPE